MRIPEYSNKVNPPPGLQAPTISPGAASAGYRGVSQLGEAVENLGQQIQQQKDNISRTRELTTRITGAERDVEDLNAQLDREKDPDTAMDKFVEGFSNIRDKWMDGVQDSKVLEALYQHFGEKEYHETTAVKHKTLQWTIERGQSEVLDHLDEYAKSATAPGVDDIGFHRNLDLAQQLIDNAAATGLYSAGKAAELKRKVRQNFFVQRYNKMIEQDPEDAIRNFGWLRQIGDPEKEVALLGKALSWAQKVEAIKDRDFREASGALLNRMLIDISMGRMSREAVNSVVGSGNLTDEHERILLHEIDSHEKSPAHSDPERLGYWKEAIEYAALRKDDATLRSFVKRVHEDPLISGEDRAMLYATIGVKLNRVENESKDFKEGYTQAISVVDRYFGFNPFSGTFIGKETRGQRDAHNEAIRKIQDASAGKSRDPKTGEVTTFTPMKGWELVDYANRLVEDAKRKKIQDRIQKQNLVNQQQAHPIPKSNDWKR